MLIRSQNKAILLNFSNSTVVYIVKNDKDFVILSLENENRYRLVQNHIRRTEWDIVN